VFVARHGRSELTTVILTADQVAERAGRMWRPTGRSLGLCTVPVRRRDADRRLPAAGRPPEHTRRHPAVNIRRFAIGLRSLDDVVASAR
jgi:pilus assembly protein CpaF